MTLPHEHLRDQTPDGALQARLMVVAPLRCNAGLGFGEHGEVRPAQPHASRNRPVSRLADGLLHRFLLSNTVALDTSLIGPRRPYLIRLLKPRH